MKTWKTEPRPESFIRVVWLLLLLSPLALCAAKKKGPPSGGTAAKAAAAAPAKSDSGAVPVPASSPNPPSGSGSAPAAANAPAGKPAGSAKTDGKTSGASKAGDDSLDVTITGQAKDEIPITKPAPSAEVPFDQIAGLSREGQTDRVLTGPIEHMSGGEQMSLLQVDSRQTFVGLPVRVPSAPFIRMEIAPGLSGVRWDLQVLDQDDRSLKAAEGTTLPKYVVEWDGFENGVFRLRAGPSYTPVLALTDDRKRVQRTFGEPVRFSALQYVQDGVFHIEFDNSRLFERGRPDLTPDMAALLTASVDSLRRRAGRPIRVVVFSSPGAPAPLVQKRLDVLKVFFKNALVVEDDMISFAVSPPADRGDVTEITTAEK